MNAKHLRRATALLASIVLAAQAAACHAQYQRRYQPSRATVSPYLNLFRPNNNVVPNYQSLVRPEQDALRFRQQQQQYDRRQTHQLDQLQTNVQVLQQPAVTSKLVAPTGKNAWFNRSGPSTFQNTSRFYSQAVASGPTNGGSAQRNRP
ncbi:MAG: hypothetical protein AB7G28_08650 [Pirellulales bacterium]